jgi:hypothetical protein
MDKYYFDIHMMKKHTLIIRLMNFLKRNLGNTLSFFLLVCDHIYMSGSDQNVHCKGNLPSFLKRWLPRFVSTYHRVYPNIWGVGYVATGMWANEAVIRVVAVINV